MSRSTLRNGPNRVRRGGNRRRATQRAASDWWLTVPGGLGVGLARAIGVTAIDIRRIRQVYDWDIWQVQLWNWRRLDVTGEQLARHITRTTIRNRPRDTST